MNNMESLISSTNWLISNKEWIFSSIDLSVIGLFIWFFKSRNSEKNKIEITANERSIAAKTLTISNSHIDNSETHNYGSNCIKVPDVP